MEGHSPFRALQEVSRINAGLLGVQFSFSFQKTARAPLVFFARFVGSYALLIIFFSRTSPSSLRQIIGHLSLRVERFHFSP